MPAKAETAIAAKNAWNEKKEIFLPRAVRGEESYVMVRVNDRTFQVPKGKPVDVPLPVYDRLKIMLDAQEKAEAYAAGVSNL